MFRDRLLEVSTQVDIIYKLVCYLSELKSYLEMGRVELSMEEMIELEHSLVGLRVFIDMIEYQTPGR